MMTRLGRRRRRHTYTPSRTCPATEEASTHSIGTSARANNNRRNYRAQLFLTPEDDGDDDEDRG